MNDPVSVSHVPGRFQSRQKPKKEFPALRLFVNLLRIAAVIMVGIAVFAAVGKATANVLPSEIVVDFVVEILIAVGIEVVAELICLAIKTERNTRK